MIVDLIPDWVKEAADECDAFTGLLRSDPVELSVTPREGGPSLVRSVPREAYDADPDRYWRDVLEEHGQGSRVH